MKTYSIEFENHIKFWLARKNMTIRELCEKIGMSEVNLYRRFKAGSIETKHLEKIANVFQIDPASFLGLKLERITDEEKQELTQIRTMVGQFLEIAKSWESLFKKQSEQSERVALMADYWKDQCEIKEQELSALKKEVESLKREQKH